MTEIIDTRTKTFSFMEGGKRGKRGFPSSLAPDRASRIVAPGSHTEKKTVLQPELWILTGTTAENALKIINQEEIVQLQREEAILRHDIAHLEDELDNPHISLSRRDKIREKIRKLQKDLETTLSKMTPHPHAA